MPKQNPYLIENKKTFETFQEVEKYEIKKSLLSPAARGKVVNKSGSNYAGDNKEGYGPMPYEGESLCGDFPTISELFNYNRGGTINFLKEKGALQTYETAHNLRFHCESTSDSDYRHEIEVYLDGLTRQFLGGNRESLRQFRKVLADYIHSKYYHQFPNWPSVGCENEASISLNIDGSYKCGFNYIEWSCVGWMTVKNQRLSYNTSVVEFSGEPEIKLSLYNSDELRQIERSISYGGVGEAKRYIDQRTDRLKKW